MEGVEIPVAELLNVSPELVPPSAPPSVRGLPIDGRLTIRASARARGATRGIPAPGLSPAAPRCPRSPIGPSS